MLEITRGRMGINAVVMGEVMWEWGQVLGLGWDELLS